MSLFTKLYEAVHSWRRRRGGPKSRKRVDLAMEQLDHRQLLAVNFTGNVPIDFPATQSPGITVIPAPSNNLIPLIPPPLQGVINKSGFQIDQLRVNYDPTLDILSVGVEGPANGRDGREVIAGDADNNGNSGTVNPNVSAIFPQFSDPADMGGSETYGIYLTLNNLTNIDVLAGFPISTGTPSMEAKPFQVGKPVSSALQFPQFDQANLLPANTGNYFLANNPNSPNFELQITGFKLLYKSLTGGKDLTPGTQIGIGAFGNSDQSTGINGEFFPTPVPFTIGTATTPPAPVPAINVTKAVNGLFAPTAPGPTVAFGSPVTFTYDVTNPGTEPLKNVLLIDDAGTPGTPGDDFRPTFVGGDTNNNGLLDPGEDFRYTGSTVALGGQYTNRATVSGVGNTSNTPVTAFTLGNFISQTPVIPPPVVPPLSPTIYVNPHANNHINSAHPTAVRVNVLGSSGFDPTKINLSTVRLGGVGTSAIDGAAPVANFERNVNRDQFPDETFVFNGIDLNLPAGVTNAEISGQTNSGQIFVSSVKVFNRDYSYYNQSQINKQQAAFARFDAKNNIPVVDGTLVPPKPVIPKAAQQLTASQAINDLYNPFTRQVASRQASAAAVGVAQPASVDGPVVSIPTKHGKPVKAARAKAMPVHMSNASVAKGPSIVQMIAGGA